MTERFLTRFVAHHVRPIKEQVEGVRRALSGNEAVQTVYVLRFPSRLLGAILSEVCRQNQLPTPKYSESAADQDDKSAECVDEHSKAPSRSSFAFLRGRAGTELVLNQRRKKRSQIEDQLSWLIAHYGAEHVRFVPVTFSVGSAPRPFSPVSRFPVDFPCLPLGEVWTVFVLLLYRNRIRLDIGPVTSPGRNTEGLSIFQRLSLLLYRKERRVRASSPVRRHTSELSVLQTGEIKRELLSLAQNRALTYQEASHRGRAYLKEIAARFSLPVIGFLRILLSFVFGRVFEGIEALNINKFREIAGEHPIILLPNHRSHFDYLLLTYTLDREGLALPYIAAGDNLNFFGVGWFLRRAGGFFIRRKVDDDPLYRLILNHYLTYLLKQGHTIEFYIEGGRSRSGAMLRPRLGLLKYIVRSILTGTRRDVYFVPVGISYERIAEDETLARERLGQPKQRESFFNALKLTKITGQRFGTVSIQFGDPISLRSLAKSMGDRNAPISDSIERAVERTEVASRSLLPELSPFTAKLAKVVTREIERNIPVTTSAIASAAILSFEGYAATRESVAQRALCLLELISYGLKESTAANWKGALLHSEFVMAGPMRSVLTKPDPVLAMVDMLDRLHTFEILVDRSQSASEGKLDQPNSRHGTDAHTHYRSPVERATAELSIETSINRAQCRYYAAGMFHHLVPLFQASSNVDEDIASQWPLVLRESRLPILQPKEELIEHAQRIWERIELVREHDVADSLLRKAGLFEGDELNIALQRLASRLCGDLE